MPFRQFDVIYQALQRLILLLLYIVSEEKLVPLEFKYTSSSVAVGTRNFISIHL